MSSKYLIVPDVLFDVLKCVILISGHEYSLVFLETTESLLFFKGLKTFHVIIKLSKSFCLFTLEV